jgi:uncharacterized LabA/DUF88 family protein
MRDVFVYVDAANIILSAQNHGLDIDSLKLVRHLTDVHRATRVMYFTGNFKSKRREFDVLKTAGVELVYKEIYNEEHKAKANCDVEIAHRMTKDALLNPPEKIVLVSGDGDFAALCDFVHERSIEMKVVAFDPISCSRVLKRRAFTKISFLIELGQRITKEKPPAGT